MKKRIAIKRHTDERMIGIDAFICGTCGEIRPVKDPSFPWCLAFERNDEISTCRKCKQKALRVPGKWEYYDIKKGIWPFRKTERYWEFEPVELSEPIYDCRPDEDDPEFLRRKLCRCALCGHVGRCLPMTDFYSIVIDGERKLKCEACMMIGLSKEEANERPNV